MAPTAAGIYSHRNGRVYAAVVMTEKKQVRAETRQKRRRRAKLCAEGQRTRARCPAGGGGPATALRHRCSHTLGSCSRTCRTKEWALDGAPAAFRQSQTEGGSGGAGLTGARPSVWPGPPPCPHPVLLPSLVLPPGTSGLTFGPHEDKTSTLISHTSIRVAGRAAGSPSPGSPGGVVGTRPRWWCQQWLLASEQRGCAHGKGEKWGLLFTGRAPEGTRRQLHRSVTGQTRTQASWRNCSPGSETSQNESLL